MKNAFLISALTCLFVVPSEAFAGIKTVPCWKSNGAAEQIMFPDEAKIKQHEFPLVILKVDRPMLRHLPSHPMYEEDDKYKTNNRLAYCAIVTSEK